MKSSPSLRVTYAKAVHDEKEEQAVLKVLREHRTILGKETSTFEQKVADYFGKKFGIMTNSGSSANLLAVELLDLPKGSEVITPMLTFSTTVAPLVMKGLVPVFVDVVPQTYQIDVTKVEKAITRKTKAIFVPNLLGNIPDMAALSRIAKRHKLFYIEDSCDTLGATFKGHPTGTYSDISTTSFYGSHIITAGGGGGMLMVNNPEWRDRAKVLRGWGRGSASLNESEDLDLRFATKIGRLPYDAKFIFGEIGYNFLPIEMGAAFGNVQLQKLPKFKRKREKNFQRLSKFFAQYADFFALPIQDPKVQTQWLSFPLTIRKTAPFTRLDIVTFLEKNNIQTRPIFTGVVTKQPGFKKIIHRDTSDSYPVSEEIMERGFVVGVHHGMEKEHIDRLEEVISSFLKPFLK
ncbi:MAG TPA: aminotransferase class I/II-fold pyridoxal phosphate-dependent enzyme [Patescibacteria group bacterium]|nr:aminotransferase class I/II-fold pyridoxal phosphate-dependent enzyme [Patescibacteria group bacterium]